MLTNLGTLLIKSGVMQHGLIVHSVKDISSELNKKLKRKQNAEIY